LRLLCFTSSWLRKGARPRTTSNRCDFGQRAGRRFI
jgi:hypothetical protein